MLHLLFKAPGSGQAIWQRLAAGDDVVFLENAVSVLATSGEWAAAIAQRQRQNRFFVLEDQLMARGWRGADLPAGVEVIDYAGLVALAVSNTHSLTWS